MLRNSAFIMIAVAMALVGLGLVMLFSVSAFVPANHGDALFFLKRQSIWLVIAITVCVIVSQIDYHFIVGKAWWIIGGASLLMLLCFVPGIGLNINNANRWLDLGILRVQPIEPFKVGVVVMLAYWLGKHQKNIHSWKEGFAYPMGMVAILLSLCLMQPDLGSTAIIFTTSFLMLFIAGTAWRFLIPLPIAGFFGLLTIAMAMPERRGRILAFLNPEAHEEGDGWQLLNALIAFGTGGVNGRGLGDSIQKMKWLPESHTDFIFPIIGEELGLICTLSVVFGFLILIFCAGLISCHAKDSYGLFLGLGLTILVTLQAQMNFAVVTGLMPTKGIGLPFISYGGSNLVICFFIMGILLNIHRQAEYSVKVRRGHLPPVIPERL